MNLALKVTGVLPIGLGAYLALLIEPPLHVSPLSVSVSVIFVAGFAMLLVRIPHTPRCRSKIRATNPRRLRALQIAGLIAALGLLLLGVTAARLLYSPDINHWTKMDTVAVLIAGLAFAVAAFKWFVKPP